MHGLNSLNKHNFQFRAGLCLLRVFLVNYWATELTCPPFQTWFWVITWIFGSKNSKCRVWWSLCKFYALFTTYVHCDLIILAETPMKYTIGIYLVIFKGYTYTNRNWTHGCSLVQVIPLMRILKLGVDCSLIARVRTPHMVCFLALVVI